MLGPIVNSVCILIGSVIGTFSGSSITPAFRNKLMF